jgi:hypothetical protein
MSDDRVLSMRSKSAAHNYNVGAHPAERSIPIEANDALRAVIQSKPGPAGLEHLAKLNDLYLAVYDKGEKRALFGARADSEPMLDLLDHVLSKSLAQLQVENVTVVGIILDVIQTMIEHPLLQKHVWGPMLYHSRTSGEILAEVNLLSKSLASLRAELNAAREREKESLSVAMAAVNESSDDNTIVETASAEQGGHNALAGVEGGVR